MKKALYWCRWAGLAPAFFLGWGLGPLTIFLCFSHFQPLRDYYGANMMTAQYVLGWMDYGSSSFGVTLICAWVAPKAKYFIAVSAGLLCTSIGLIYWASESTSFGVFPSPYIWVMFEGYVVGICLAVVCLFWIFSKRPISN
jgi:hypothetical protein